MKIAVNFCPDTKPKGWQITFEELLKVWKRQNDGNEYFLVSSENAFNTEQYLIERGLSPIQASNIHLRTSEQTGFEGSFTWCDDELRVGPNMISQMASKPRPGWPMDKKMDIALHVVAYVSIPLAQLAAKQVSMIYDCIGFHEQYSLPEWTEYNKIVRDWARTKLDLVLTPSQASKIEIQKFYDFDPEKIFVVPLAPRDFSKFAFDSARRKRILDKENIMGPYIMSSSTFLPHKNFSGLLDAWRKVNDTIIGRQFTLILTGDWFTEIDLLPNVRLLHYLTDEDLFCLMGGSTLYVCPSFMEGFGLPLLEAMSCGVPVCCSNTSSLPEVAGDFGYYFNPNDTTDIANVIESALKLSDLQRRELGDLVYRRSKLFSWQDTAKKISEAFQILVEGKN